MPICFWMAIEEECMDGEGLDMSQGWGEGTRGEEGDQTVVGMQNKGKC